MYILPTQILENNAQNKNYLVLGKWCLNSDIEKKINIKNNIILNYHWDDRKKFERDYLYLNKLNISATEFLTKNLNKIHNVNFSNKYWYKILGYWLTHFVSAFFDRYQMLKNAQAYSNDLKLETFENFETKYLAANDTTAFIQAIQSDSFNLALFTEISKYLDNINIIYNIKTDYFIKDSQKNFKYKSKIINYLYKFFPKNFKKIIISKAQISILHSFQLSLLTKNIFLPIYFPHFEKNIKFNETIRDWSLEDLKVQNEFEKIFYKSLPKCLPRIFLEGYIEANKMKNNFEKNINLNPNPSLIFTCNAHLRDELFKLWMAEKCENGSKFISYQHGCGCKGKLDQVEIFENCISEIRLKPSIKDELNDKKNLNVGRYNFRLKIRNQFVKKPKILIALFDTPRYSNFLIDRHVSSQFLYYLEDQKNFYKYLDNKIKKETLIRLNPKTKYWRIKSELKNKFSKIKFDKNKSFSQSLKKVSLFIGTYNATTYNETLLANIPTIFFWDEKYSKVSDQDKKNFDLLKNVGIFHDDAIQAAKYVNKISNHLETWWEDPNLQRNVKIFCQNYSGNSNKIFVKKFSKLINDAIQ